MPEEILNDHPDRLRAVIVSGCNPLRSYADTSQYEKAFEALDLLETIEPPERLERAVENEKRRIRRALGE